jgi:hypothetical protein
LDARHRRGDRGRAIGGEARRFGRAANYQVLIHPVVYHRQPGGGRAFGTVLELRSRPIALRAALVARCSRHTATAGA